MSVQVKESGLGQLVPDVPELRAAEDVGQREPQERPRVGRRDIEPLVPERPPAVDDRLLPELTAEQPRPTPLVDDHLEPRTTLAGEVSQLPRDPAEGVGVPIDHRTPGSLPECGVRLSAAPSAR